MGTLQHRKTAGSSRTSWRYTDPALFTLDTENILPRQHAEGKTIRSLRNSFEKARHSAEAISKNGKLIDIHIHEDLSSKGVLLLDLHSAARKHRDLLEPHLGQIVGAIHGKFEALNTALWQGGLFVYIPRGVVIEDPIHLAFLGDQYTPFLASRLLVVMEENSQATIVNEYASPDESELYANNGIELFLGAASRLQYVTLQNWGEKVKTYVTQRASIQRDSQLLSIWAGLGGKIVKADLRTHLSGPGANTKLLGMSFAQHQQHFDQHTEHIHHSGNTYSDLDFKVALKDKARSIYTGQIRIDQEARNCEAYQENRNLLLSEKTRADTIPELEILNDEVSCSHGATIGPVDEEMLYYLAARGIPRDEAVRMIVTGFVEPTLKAVPEDLQDRLRSYITERVREI